MDTLCPCLSNPEAQVIARIDAAITRAIAQDIREQRRQIKILLLGTGEAGKSTIIKQMKIIHGNGYQLEERIKFVSHVHSNIVESLQILMHVVEVKTFRLGDSRTSELYKDFRDLDCLHTRIALSPVLLSNAWKIWSDEGVQQAYEARKDFQLGDSTKYFMGRLEAINDPGYTPTDEDILRVRVRTTAIEEYPFDIEKARFRIMDVGGQRSERRKWIHCFENVIAIFFIASLSEYDQFLFESQQVNRMQESLALFREVLNHDISQACVGIWFKTAAVILFLNKTDIFEEKIKNSHLRDYLDDYEGPSRNSETARDFIHDKYLACRMDDKRDIYVHFTCATDTSQIDHVFNSVRHNILLRALNDTPLL